MCTFYEYDYYFLDTIDNKRKILDPISTLMLENFLFWIPFHPILFNLMCTCVMFNILQRVTSLDPKVIKKTRQVYLFIWTQIENLIAGLEPKIQPPQENQRKPRGTLDTYTFAMCGTIKLCKALLNSLICDTSTQYNISWVDYFPWWKCASVRSASSQS